MKKEVNRGLESTVIVGRIYGEFSEDGPIIVAAYSVKEGMKNAHYTILYDYGEYELMDDQDKYYVFAYRDKNSNLMSLVLGLQPWVQIHFQLDES